MSFKYGKDQDFHAIHIKKPRQLRVARKEKKIKNGLLIWFARLSKYKLYTDYMMILTANESNCYSELKV